MSYFDSRPQLFRAVFGLLAVYCILLAGINFYRYASSPTDENLFADPKSSLYITADMEADDEGSTKDSVLAGDLILSVDGSGVSNRDELTKVLARFPEESDVTITVQRQSRASTYQLRLKESVLTSPLVRELPPVALVLSVTSDGASDRAGMKAGDVILRINGESFTSATDADHILRRGQSGKAIEYEVLRKNKLVTLHVTLASFGLPLYVLGFVLAGLVYLVTGSFLALSRPQHAAARLLGLFLFTIGFALLMGTIQRDVQTDIITKLRGVSFALAVFFGIAFSIHANHYFPKERPALLSRKWIHITGYLLAAVATITAIIFGANVGGVGIAIMVVYAIIVPLIYRKYASAEYKAMARTIRWGGAITGVTSGALFFYIFKTGGTNIHLLVYLGLILLLIPASYLYTIGKYRLLDLRLRMRKNIQYSVAMLAWSGLTFVALLWSLHSLLQLGFDLPNVQLTGASIELIDGPMPPTDRALWEKGTLVVAGIGLAFMFRWAGKSGLRIIDRKFYRAQYDYRRAASEFAEVMGTRLNMNDLARGIVEKLADLMHTKRVGVLFFKNQSITCCHEVHGFNGREWDAFCLCVGDELSESLMRVPAETHVDYLPKALKEEFRRNEFQYVIPIRSKEKLVGALLVGEKLSESAYHAEDLEFLASVAKQASVAIENAFLHEELTEQERMKHELEIARRIQLASLPQTTPKIDGLDIAGISVPAFEVGGDYFDYLNGDPRRLTVIVGDVSGKGTSAALYMSKIQGILRSLHGFGLSPRELFMKTNLLLSQDMEKKSFVTAIAGIFQTETRSVVLARAGHLPLFHFRAEAKSVVRVLPRGLGLGLSIKDVFGTELEELRVGYGAGDVFLFVTDGITEARTTAGEQFGEERLESVVQEVAQQPAAAIRDRVIEAVKQFTGNAPQHDDQTIVVVKTL